VPSVEHVHDVSFDAKDDAVHVWAAAAEKLSDFSRSFAALRSHGTAGWQARQRPDGGSEPYEPVLTGVSGVLRLQPLVDRSDVLLCAVRGPSWSMRVLRDVAEIRDLPRRATLKRGAAHALRIEQLDRRER